MLERHLRDFSRVILHTGAAAFLTTSCNFGIPKEIPTPTQVATPARAATPRPGETPIRIESSPTFSAEQLNDRVIRSSIQQAENGKILQLDQPLLEYVIRFPWEGGQAYVVTLSTLDEHGKAQIASVLLSSDCIFDSLRARNELGNTVVSGVWKQNRRVDGITVQVSVPESVVVPVAVLDMKDITNHGVARNCREVRAIDRLKELISKVNWKSIPEKSGEFAGWFTREFLEGLRRGFSRTTPTPHK